VVRPAATLQSPQLADEAGHLPLPWLAQPLADALARQRGHAWLIQGATGIGALPYVLTLAQALLCENPQGQATALGPCGHCGSCKLVRTHLHPDLLVLLPETLRRAHGWLLVDDKVEGEDGKRKPSRQIRIDEIRALIDWSTKTSARGRGKVVVVHPAEALNPQSANALLKTLEEPAPGTRLLLTTADAALLLPTVRSRCQHQVLPAPDAALAVAWLQQQGVDQPLVLLAGCSGRPLDALALSQGGVDAGRWAALPQAVAAGRSAGLADWSVPQAVDALQKLCHDAMLVASGAATRYFPVHSVPARGRMSELADWWLALARVARHDEHPWHEALLLDALVRQGADALCDLPTPRPVAARRLDTLPR
jgi:DNA polymerase-3 subunit delta'